MNLVQKVIKFGTSYVRLIIKDVFEKNEMIQTDDSIVLLNTEIGSDNLGDCVIMLHCRKALSEMFPDVDYIEIASHLPASKEEIEVMKKAKAVIVCGTNFLASRLEMKAVWKFEDEMRKIPNLVLMGVGSGDYARQTPYTSRVFKRILKNQFTHSVRDEYTYTCLKKMGINNVLNTNCVTLWDIEEQCAAIPVRKGKSVVTTITGYYKDVENDRLMLDILKKNYDEVFFWPQGKADLGYAFDNLDLEGIRILDRSMEAYEECLKHDDLDYVGSRLHGGIHAIHHGKRTIILGVDNRAKEIARDTNLPVIDMKQISEKLEKTINSEWKTDIYINNDMINEWKKRIKNILNK